LHTKWATTCTIGKSIYKNLKLKKKERKKRISITLRV
jgi:ribosomal protein L40E